MSELRAIEQKLRASRAELSRQAELLRSVVDNAPIGTALVARDGVFLRVNRALCEIVGYDESELVGMTFQEITHPDDLDADLEYVRQLLAGEIRSYRMEKRYRHRIGHFVWVRLSVSQLGAGDDAPSSLIAQIEDITAAKGVEQALQASEARLTALVEHIPASVALRDRSGRYELVNPFLAAQVGQSQERLLGAVPSERFPADVVAHIAERDAHVLQSGEPHAAEVSIPHPDGTRHRYHSVWFPVPDAAGKIASIGTISVDITERKRAEEQLRDRERQLADAQALAQLGSWELDLETDRLMWSDELCRICALPPGTTPTYHEFLAIVHPDDRAALERDVVSARASEFSAGDYRIVRPDGEVRHVHTRRYGRFDESGRLTHLWGATQDVTDRIIAEHALRQAKDHAEAITTAMGEGYALTINGTLASVNDRMCELTGFTRDELVGAGMPFPFWPTDQLAESRAIRDRVVDAGGGTFEIRLMRADQSRFDAEITAYPAHKPDGSLLGFVNTVRDISERKRYEAALERERRNLHDAQAIARIGSWEYDAVGDRPGPASAEFWRLLGVPPRESAPRLEEFAMMLRAEDQPRLLEQARLMRHEHRPVNDEFTLVRPDGQELRIAVRAEVAYDEHGKPLTAFGTVQDITARAQRDLEQSALREIAELVAGNPGAAPVFAAVARNVQSLFGALHGTVTRFDADAGIGTVVAGYPQDSTTTTGISYSLDGTAPSAQVWQTGRPAQFRPPRPDEADPAVRKIIEDGISGGVAAPIVVAGKLWGTLGAAFAGRPVPTDAEERLSRFADLMAMAIANADAWEGLARAAATDSVTSIANHRTFRERLQTELARAQRYDRDLSLVLFDIDHFKRVNDTHGHLVGDQVLAEVARRIAAQARDGELVARVGGEEFAWLIPEADAGAARHAAERARRTIESTPFPQAGALTISAGVSASRALDIPDQIVDRADRALYQAKADGRNRTIVSTADDPVVTSR